ncbi:unnamed protein product [Caenorhabditis sp. 36 PRJEB53466]|nr:unnamed protein product [Caenorhabditis sp. 36 PRJEB53466]
MLHSAALVDIVNKTLPYQALGGSLLPVNNNAEFMSHTNAITVTICDQEEPIAFGSIVKCNERQAYVMLGEVDKKFEDKTVWIEQTAVENKLNFAYKITKSVPLVDYSGETYFEQTFADRDEKPVHLHLLDVLINNSVGLIGMDVSKNITVDFEKFSNFASWRDTVGFVVGDKHLFERITVNRFELLSLESDNSNVDVEDVRVEKLTDVLDYDAEVSIFDREDFLTSLLKTGGVSAKVAKVQGQVVGYVVNTKDNILQCYGDEEHVQRALFSAAAANMNPKVTMYVRKQTGPLMDQLSESAEEKVAITRLNTRVIINTIKFNKIACLNMGLHLF